MEEEDTSGSSTESLNCLKFGHKIYFEDSPPAPPKKLRSAQAPRCQVEGCHVDLSDAKSYYSRHKVCGTHSKTPTVVVSGLEQRFCQQCSRFHLLPEFDQGKRSCRRRLAGHNERRRKPTPGSLLSARYEDAGGRVGGFLMDFSAYPRLGRDTWPDGRISEHTPPTGKVLPYTWQGNISEDPPLSDLFLQTTAGPSCQVAGECFPAAAAADSSCALSLLSNQAWCPRARSLPGFGHHSLGAPPTMAAPLGGAAHHFPGTPWGSGSHQGFHDLGLGQIPQPLAGDYSGERTFMETSGDYDHSGQHMNCSL